MPKLLLALVDTSAALTGYSWWSIISSNDLTDRSHNDSNSSKSFNIPKLIADNIHNAISPSPSICCNGLVGNVISWHRFDIVIVSLNDECVLQWSIFII